MPKPTPGTYPEYFQRYIDQVPEEELLTAFANQSNLLPGFLGSISEEKSLYAYAPGKWSLREMLQHIIDTERIFCFRALCFARKDPNNIAGFEEDEYAKNSHANDRSWQSLVEEFMLVRKGGELLFQNFNAADLDSSGTANNNPTSVGSIGFILVGHFYHHKKVIEERYL